MSWYALAGKVEVSGMSSSYRFLAFNMSGTMVLSAFLSAVLTFPGAPQTAAAQDPFAGNIRSIESDDPAGHVRIIRLGYAGVIAGKPGAAVFIGDTLKTAAGMKAQIELSDATMITLAPNSSVQIKGHLIDKGQAKRNTVLRSLKGTVRFLVAKLFRVNGNGGERSWKDSQVTIETMNAVAGVRGTDLVVKDEQGSSEIAVLEGVVHVRSTIPSNRGDVVLGANQYSSTRKGGSPSPAAELSAEKRDALVRATTIDRPRKAGDGGAADARKTKKYSDKDVARDLAAGLALGEVLDKAVESGMGVDEAVTAALNAGASASGVVYTAITEGYPAHTVVQAAIENGVTLTIVVSAALAAGAERSLVVAGATDAGVPPAAIANAVAAASGTVAGGGGALPSAATPSSIIPSAPLPIGGGGGATPSTQPASPYKP